MRYSLALLCYVATMLSASFAQTVQFSANASKNTVKQGEVFDIEFWTNAERFDQFSAPDFEPFQVVSGPGQSSQTTIVNGQRTHRFAIRYSLLANKEGTFKILPATATIQGTPLTSNALKIKVKKNDILSSDEPRAEEDIFIKIEIDQDTAYVGQQIIVDYVLYSNVQTRGASVVETPLFKDFYVQNPSIYPRNTQRITIGDRLYEYRILQRYALFPQFPGELQADQLIASVSAILDGEDTGSFFFFGRTKKITVASETKTIKVLSLPEPKPEGFCGAVGSFDIRATVNRSNPKVNQAVLITYQITGDGDIKKIYAPQLHFPPGVEVYEPKLVQEENSERNGRIRSTRIYEYILVPKEVGAIDLQLRASYFDPELNQYIEPPLRDIKIVVRQGHEEENMDAILFGTEPDQETDADKPLFRWGIPLASTALISLMALLYFRQKKHLAQNSQDTSSWEEKAKTYLQDARRALDRSEAASFYTSIRLGIYGYMAHKLGIPLADLTHQSLLEALKKQSVPGPLIEQAQQLIKQSEIALFAGLGSDQDMQSSYDNAVDLLTKLEAYFDQ